jgi:hypothetical protein
LRSDEGESAEEFWKTYIQLTVVEHAFRVLKGEVLPGVTYIFSLYYQFLGC